MTLHDRQGVRVSYLPLLGLWAFRAQGATVQLPGHPTHFPTRAAAELAAVSRGLKVDRFGRVWPGSTDLRSARP